MPHWSFADDLSTKYSYKYQQMSGSVCVSFKSTPNRASSGQFPEHQAQRIDIRPLEWLKAVHIDCLIQDLRGHVPAEEKVIMA